MTISMISMNQDKCYESRAMNVYVTEREGVNYTMYVRTQVGRGPYGSG